MVIILRNQYISLICCLNRNIHKSFSSLRLITRGLFQQFIINFIGSLTISVYNISVTAVFINTARLWVHNSNSVMIQIKIFFIRIEPFKNI